MASKRRVPIDESALTKEKYEEIRVLWSRLPDMHAIARDTNIPIFTVERIVKEGLPKLGLAPLQPPRPKRLRKKSQNATRAELVRASLGLRATEEAEDLSRAVQTQIKQYEKDAAQLVRQIDRLREKGVSEEAITHLREAFNRTLVLEKHLSTIKQEALAGDQLKRSADEAAASRMALRTAASVAGIVSHLTERILQGLEDGSVTLPDKLDLRSIVMLSRAADTSASAVERALIIERKRLGRPESTLGIQLGTMLESCTDEELDEIKRNGRPVPRLLGTAGEGRRIVDAVADEDREGDDGQ